MLMAVQHAAIAQFDLNLGGTLGWEGSRAFRVKRHRHLRHQRANGGIGQALWLEGRQSHTAMQQHGRHGELR